MELDYLDALRYAVDYNIHYLGKWNTQEENKMDYNQVMKKQLIKLFHGADPLDCIQDATVEYGDEGTTCVVRMKVPDIHHYAYKCGLYPMEPLAVTARHIVEEQMRAMAMCPVYTCDGAQKEPEKEPPKPADNKRKPMELRKPERVVYSGPKTIVFWPDGTKTMVSLMEGEKHDEYGAFCAAFLKKMFGSTHKAKKFLNSIKVVQEPKVKKEKAPEVRYESREEEV